MSECFHCQTLHLKFKSFCVGDAALCLTNFYLIAFLRCKQSSALFLLISSRSTWRHSCLLAIARPTVNQKYKKLFKQNFLKIHIKSIKLIECTCLKSKYLYEQSGNLAIFFKVLYSIVFSDLSLALSILEPSIKTYILGK